MIALATWLAEAISPGIQRQIALDTHRRNTGSDGA
jgi:hypothetical protein